MEVEEFDPSYTSVCSRHVHVRHVHVYRQVLVLPMETDSDSEDNLLYEMPRDPIHDVCFCYISFIFTS